MSDEDSAKVKPCPCSISFHSRLLDFVCQFFLSEFCGFCNVAAACSICDWDFKCTFGGLFRSSGYSRKIL
jgi:hypothetical protein